jgi:hypothetical protein
VKFFYSCRPLIHKRPARSLASTTAAVIEFTATRMIAGKAAETNMPAHQPAGPVA